MNSHSLSTFERGTASVGMLELADAVHKEFCENYETWRKDNPNTSTRQQVKFYS